MQILMNFSRVYHGVFDTVIQLTNHSSQSVLDLCGTVFPLGRFSDHYNCAPAFGEPADAKGNITAGSL